MTTDYEAVYCTQCGALPGEDCSRHGLFTSPHTIRQIDAQNYMQGLMDAAMDKINS